MLLTITTTQSSSFPSVSQYSIFRACAGDGNRRGKSISGSARQCSSVTVRKYDQSVHSYFSAQESEIRPRCIVRPSSTADVSNVVSHLVKANYEYGLGSIKFAIRSGGHASFVRSANEPNGVTIDLRKLNSIHVTDDQNQVIVGAGASWGQVYRKLDPLGLAIPGGRHSQVGVGGLTLGGGLSHFSGHVGLACDNVDEYEVVLATGAIVRIKKEGSTHSDLYLALRGSGNNFGVVTEFTFRAFRQGHLWGGTLIHGPETNEQHLNTFFNFASNPEPDPCASLIHGFGMSAERGSGFVNGIVYTKPTHEPVVIQPFLNLNPVYMNSLRELSLTELTQQQDAFNENGLCQVAISTTYYLSETLLTRTYELWLASQESVKNLAGLVWSMTLQTIFPAIVAKSGFLQDAIPAYTAERGSIIVAQLTGTWKDAKDSPAAEKAALKLISDIEDAVEDEKMQTGYLYLNYAHPGQDVFGDDSINNGQRKEFLQGVSKKYDGDGVFQRCVIGGLKLF
ncbi:FAD binding domain protein [Viridothelium virens]|uniref:FAD binding domain protein n=1 Tax=Viridothelium virens TaxID=1048519 RepID=A0A6A6HIN7_VIRVR|nr:FAD binding domain protein [Viridothelium virens]